MIVAAALAQLMIDCVLKLFTGDIGTNHKIWHPPFFPDSGLSVAIQGDLLIALSERYQCYA